MLKVLIIRCVTHCSILYSLTETIITYKIFYPVVSKP